jgi:hypothetical protein
MRAKSVQSNRSRRQPERGHKRSIRNEPILHPRDERSARRRDRVAFLQRSDGLSEHFSNLAIQFIRMAAH